MLKVSLAVIGLIAFVGVAEAQSPGTVMSGDNLDKFMMGDVPAPKAVKPQDVKRPIIPNRKPVGPPAQTHSVVPPNWRTTPAAEHPSVQAVEKSSASLAAAPSKSLWVKPSEVVHPAPKAAAQMQNIHGAEEIRRKPPGEKSATETGTLSDSDAVHQIESAEREERVLAARAHVLKLKAEIKKQEADIRKTDAESAGVKKAALPERKMAPPPPPHPIPIVKPVTQGVGSGTRFETVSIAGPSENLVAVLHVDGFGDVRVRAGSMLPDNFEVVSVGGRGVSVRRIGGNEKNPVVLVPFVGGR